MQTATINVPFEARLETNDNFYSYVDHPLVCMGVYERASTAKKTLKARLIQEVQEALLHKKNTTGRAIGLDTGEVFIVRYGIGGWSYAIVGVGRKFGGSCLVSGNTFQSTYDAAKKHAESQGTIIYDCSI
jgi:hypothetical protein